MAERADRRAERRAPRAPRRPARATAAAPPARRSPPARSPRRSPRSPRSRSPPRRRLDSGASGSVAASDRQWRAIGKRGDGAKPAGSVRNATPQPDWKPHTGPVPILEYHVLGAPPADAPYPELYVTRPDFRQPDGLARRARLPGGDPRTGRGRLVPTAARCRRSRSSSPSTTATGRSSPSPCRSCASTAGPACSTSRRKAPTSTTSNVEAMIAAGWELAAHTIHHLDLTDARRRRAGGRSRRLAGRSCAANTASR